MTNDKKKPIQKVQSGPVSGAIWKNEGSDGAFYSATFERSYKDKDSDEYKSSASFGANDLAHLALCSVKASLAIDTLMATRTKGSR